MTRQAFGQESMSHTCKFQTHRPKECSQRICPHSQTVNYARYCDLIQRLLENVRRLRPELWRQKNWLLHHDEAPSHTTIFTREFWLKTTRLSTPTHPTPLSFPDWRWDRKASILTILRWLRQNQRRCWTPSQDAFRSGRIAGNGASEQNVTATRVMVPSGLKLSFWSDDSTSPENYGWLFIICNRHNILLKLSNQRWWDC
jgi:hypothetical protein